MVLVILWGDRDERVEQRWGGMAPEDLEKEAKLMAHVGLRA